MPTRPFVSAIACASLLAAACAPDAYAPSPQFNAFLTKLQQACAGQTIGPRATVDNLIQNSESNAGDFFMDQTSRLFFGTTSPQDYATGVSSFLNGWPSDPGVQCVLREYEQQRQFTTPQPSAAPPADSDSTLRRLIGPLGPSPQFNAFLTKLQQACAGQTIGPRARVDNLIQNSQSNAGAYFINQTSRLYAGTTTPQDYATGVSAFLNGWPSDPGVQCVLREYNQQRQLSTPPPPSSAPPAQR